MSYAAAGIAAYQIWSGLQQAESIRESAKLTKEISEMNAKYAEIDAYEAEKSGYGDTARYQTTIDNTIADQRTGYAAQNVDVNFGTAAEVQADTKLTGFLNQLDIQKQARAKALGYKREARQIRLQGSMGNIQARSNASATVTTGLIHGANTALSGYDRTPTVAPRSQEYVSDYENLD